MGFPNVQTKDYIRQNDHFADLCNYYLFDGHEIIKPEELEERVCKGMVEALSTERRKGINEGMEKGIAKQLLLSVEKLRSNLELDLAEACAVLDISLEEYENAKVMFG